MRPYLVSWRLRGVLVWLAYKVTFGSSWLWARRVIPGELLVSTTSRSAADALTEVLDKLRSGPALRLHRVNQAEDLVAETYRSRERQYDHFGPTSRMPVEAAWWASVRPGTEQAVLREIEYRVAVAMARKGDFEGIGRRALLAVGRAAIAANQVRKAQLSSWADPPGPVEFKKATHAAYCSMLGLGVEPTRQVQVAVLDSAVRISDIPNPNQCPINIDYSIEAPEDRPPFAHGAVTAALICNIAGNASICVYPVMDAAGQVSERAVYSAFLGLLTREVAAEVVVLCLGMAEESGLSTDVKTARSNLRRLFQLLGRDLVVVVSTGNTDDDDLKVLEPARRKIVYAVGAVNQAGRRAWFSRSVFPVDEHPALYLLAPGGDSDGYGRTEEPATVHGVGQRGSSIAAAYAAGIVTRTLGTIGTGTAVRDHITVALRRATQPVGPDADAGPFCDGLIRQPASGWNEAIALESAPPVQAPLEAQPVPSQAETVLARAVTPADGLLDPALVHIA